MKLIFILFLLHQTVALSQVILEKAVRVNGYSAGLFYNYSSVTHNLDFSNFTEFIDCNKIEYGKSINDGFKFGVNGTIPINEFIRFYPSCSYSKTNFGTNTRDRIPINMNGSLEESVIINEIEGSINGFCIETMLGFNFFDRFFISVGVSSELIVDLILNKYIYLENAQYKKLQDIYNMDKRKILYFTPIIELTYDFFLGSKDFGIVVAPLLKYEFSIYPFLEEKDWKFSKISFGISVRYTDNVLKFREY